MGKKVFITGMGGYIGGCLAAELDRTDWCDAIYGMDVRPPLDKFVKADFRKMDVNAQSLIDWACEVAPDVFIHLAFIVDPIPDERLMHRVNVDGTRNAMAAAHACGARQVLVASSGTAYGAWPDNPVPLKESDPIRQHPTFKYAFDKAEVEFICRDFEKKYPDVILSIIRPCVVYGRLVNNYLSNLVSPPVVVAPRDSNPDLQFIHEQDVVGAIMTIIEQEARGPVNLAPADAVSLRESIAMTKKPALFLPDSLLRPLVGAMWNLRLPLLKAPPSFLDYMRYPWVLDSARLREELGYSFKYSSRETYQVMLRAKGILP